MQEESAALRFPPLRVLLVIGAASLVFVVVLGLKLQDVRGPVRVDDAARSHFLGDTPAYERGPEFRDIVDLGSTGPVVVSITALALWAMKRRDRAGLLLAVAGPAGAIFLTEAVLKPLIERRAPAGALSYPSGHVTAVTSIAVVALLLVFRYAGPGWAVVWSPVALAASIAIAVAVVDVGWHYATDSVAGLGVGVGVVCLLAAASDQFFRPTYANSRS